MRFVLLLAILIPWFVTKRDLQITIRVGIAIAQRKNV